MDVDEAPSIIAEANPDFVRFRDDSRFWIQKVLLPIIGTVGIFGNIATILVLTRRGMRTSTNAYLTALAVADLIYLISVFWLSLRHYSFINEDPIWSFIYSHVWPYSLWIADATRRVLCTVSRAKRVIIGVYLICFTTSMTTPFEWAVEETTDPKTNTFEIASSNLGKMKIYKTIYYWFTSITFVLLPLTMLIIFNSFLIHSFRQSQKLRRIMAVRQKVSEREEIATRSELKITSTLITIVIMFLVCQLPTATTLIYEIFLVTKLTANEEAVLRALGNIFNCLVALNAACNFILYCALSEKYRRGFMLTFFPCFYQPPSSAKTKAFFTRQVEGPKGVHHFTNRRHSSYYTTSVKLNTKVSSQKFSSRHQRMSSASATTCRKVNRFIVALPIISENGSLSDTLIPANNPNQTAVVIQHFNPPFSAVVPCHHQSSTISSLVSRKVE